MNEQLEVGDIVAAVGHEERRLGVIKSRLYSVPGRLADYSVLLFRPRDTWYPTGELVPVPHGAVVIYTGPAPRSEEEWVAQYENREDDIELDDMGVM